MSPSTLARGLAAGLSLFLLAALGAAAQLPLSDAYTRYELGDPESKSFRVLFDVTVGQPGATVYFDPVQAGQTVSDVVVVDRATGEPLPFEVLGGDRARRRGLPDARPGREYLRVELAHPVPDGGEARIHIGETYRDPTSYHADGEHVVFARRLGVVRNSVALPPGWELVGCNLPAQVRTEDGRVVAGLVNPTDAAVDLELRMRRLPQPEAAEDDVEEESAPAEGTAEAAGAAEASAPASQDASKRGEAVDGILRAPPPLEPLDADLTFFERAGQDREAVYFLRDPATHSYRLVQQHTEREGAARFVEVVPLGSTAESASARRLDTGEELKVRHLRGQAVREAGIELGRQIGADTEVVIVRFDALGPGRSMRLRVEQVLTDPRHYGLTAGPAADRGGSEFAFVERLGRTHNAVVLPAGWALSACSVPGRVTLTDADRIRVDITNDRTDPAWLVLTGRPRGGR